MDRPHRECHTRGWPPGPGSGHGQYGMLVGTCRRNHLSFAVRATAAAWLWEAIGSPSDP
ncbi:hypothetical protein BZL29_6729 [Mycobacterium kansasii]|uniref:Uncharacterized protein n=1 Tax=Mycobacterium kansasii TaxID=1768 RepID=A0A1V3WM33_MYCKA|nr:hypothetical protein BZL29_6729 [Mycobacterium kansasii]